MNYLVFTQLYCILASMAIHQTDTTLNNPSSLYRARYDLKRGVFNYKHKFCDYSHFSTSFGDILFLCEESFSYFVGILRDRPSN